jgi:hypothetical protein
MLIKNRLIIEDEFVKAFTGLMSLTMPAKQCLEVSSCIEDLGAQYTILLRARRAIVDKYCTKDEGGNPAPDERGNLLFESPEIQKKCMDEIAEILDEEIDIALSDKIKVPKNTPMTPLKVRLLQDLIEIEN